MGRGQLYAFLIGFAMNWKETALVLYFKLFGKRCVFCSKLVSIEEAYLEQKGEDLYLLHEQCKGLR